MSVRPTDKKASAGEAGTVPRRGELSRGLSGFSSLGENPRADDQLA